MYSKVKIARHPIHPMLIAFPVAFYTATFACFITYNLNLNPFWFRVGYVANIAGVAMAIIAAIPGVIDWAAGIPSDSQAKTTGLIHMVLNVTALVFFAANLWAMSGKYNDPQPESTGAVLLTGMGFLFTLAAGYFGWTLVQTHHVGVDLTRSQEELEPVHRKLFSSDHPHRRAT